MRILLINHEFTISGASTVLSRLARALRANGHDVTLYPIVGTPGAMLNAFVADGIAVRDALHEDYFDLAIANTICAAEIVLRIGTSVRTVWWIHEAETGLAHLMEDPRRAAAFKVAAAIVFQTDFQRDTAFARFIRESDRHRVFVIANAVEPKLPDAAALAKIPPPRAGALRIMFLGSIGPRKGPEMLIEAVRRLPHRDIECVICGKYYFLPEADRETLRAGGERYRLLLDRPDGVVAAWLASSHVFCLPSVSETQGIAAYEAALLGKPLILSDLPCHHGIFAHGRNALLFPSRDVDMLAFTIDGVADRPALRERLGRAARDTALRFTRERFFTEFGAMLRSIGVPIW